MFAVGLMLEGRLFPVRTLTAAGRTRRVCDRRQRRGVRRRATCSAPGRRGDRRVVRVRQHLSHCLGPAQHARRPRRLRHRRRTQVMTTHLGLLALFAFFVSIVFATADARHASRSSALRPAPLRRVRRRRARDGLVDVSRCRFDSPRVVVALQWSHTWRPSSYVSVADASASACRHPRCASACGRLFRIDGAGDARGRATGTWTRVTFRTLVVAWLITVAYGASDEWHQMHVPFRTAELRDLIADAIGACRRRNRPQSVGYNQTFMSFDNLLVERDGAVAVVTINRPKVRNALNGQTMRELRQAMEELQQDASVGAIVLTGAGEKAFVAGADINELAVLSPVEGKEHARSGQAVLRFHRAVSASRSSRRSTDSRSAAAASWRWRARFASPPTRAHFGQPEINLGIMPGYAGSQRLPRLVGKGLALEILLTGDMITAERALRNRPGQSCRAGRRPADRSEEAGRRARIESADRHALHHRSRQSRRRHVRRPTREFLEATLFGLVASTDDMKEGTHAFLEKRSPQWKGK